GGKLLIPLGERYQQVFYLFEKQDGKLQSKELIPTLFVPMTGLSEDRRQVRPDPARPQILNGSFEDDDNSDGRPDGWHYLRQATLREGEAAAGARFLQIENDEPGRLAQTLQGFAVDGRKVAMLDVSAEMRATDLRVGPNRNERPGVVLLLFDEVRKTIATVQIEPDRESDGWSRRSRRVPLPPQTREAILAVTLGGGTGTLDVDDVTITPTPR